MFLEVYNFKNLILRNFQKNLAINLRKGGSEQENPKISWQGISKIQTDFDFI